MAQRTSIARRLAGSVDSRVLAPHPETARRYMRLGYGVAVTDALCVMVAIAAVRVASGGLRFPSDGFYLFLVGGGIVWVGCFVAFGLYSFVRLSPREEFRRLLEASAVAVGVKALISLIHGKGAIAAISRGWVVLIWAIALLLTMITREIWHKRMGAMRAAGRLNYRTVIVGANEEAWGIAAELGREGLGFQPVGMIETRDGNVIRDGLPILGSVDELAEIIRERAVECVFIASSAVTSDIMKRISKHVRRGGVEVRVSANLTDVLASRLTVAPVGNMLALSLRPATLSGAQAAVKRTFDLLVASAGLLVTAPAWLVAALLVKVTSAGPVLFRQTRVGRGGRTFTMYKFRTMVQGAELLRAHLLHRNEASGPLFKMREDPRVTRVGATLRRWSLDELPQLLNVLKGDMSIVGPRPPLPSEVATYEEWHHDRLEVRPGITGVWQVGGRSELSFDDYVRLDLFYIENWSLTYDLFVMAKTVPAVLSRKGAF